MSRALLDINVLLALLDSDHVDFRRAHDWLDDNLDAGWASCAITENGFVRVISQPRYPSPVSPAVATSLLARASRTGSHEFWACDVSLLDAQVIDSTRLHGPRQVTDAYLLALAVARGGRFVTFDSSAVVSGPSRRPGAADRAGLTTPDPAAAQQPTPALITPDRRTPPALGQKADRSGPSAPDER